MQLGAMGGLRAGEGQGHLQVQKDPSETLWEGNEGGETGGCEGKKEAGARVQEGEDLET